MASCANSNACCNSGSPCHPTICKGSLLSALSRLLHLRLLISRHESLDTRSVPSQWGELLLWSCRFDVCPLHLSGLTQSECAIYRAIAPPHSSCPPSPPFLRTQDLGAWSASSSERIASIIERVSQRQAWHGQRQRCRLSSRRSWMDRSPGPCNALVMPRLATNAAVLSASANQQHPAPHPELSRIFPGCCIGKLAPVTPVQISMRNTWHCQACYRQFAIVTGPQEGALLRYTSPVQACGQAVRAKCAHHSTACRLEGACCKYRPAANPAHLLKCAGGCR